MSWDRIHSIFMGLSILSLMPAMFVVVPILIVRAVRKTPEKMVRKVYGQLPLSETPQPGLVGVRFHTYGGFFVWVSQMEHQVYATPEIAEALLGRALRYNLSHGLLAYGGLLVPLVSVPEYFSQKRSIRRQKSESQFSHSVASAPILYAVESSAENGSTHNKWARLTLALAVAQTFVFIMAAVLTFALRSGDDAVLFLGLISTVFFWLLALELR